jgi:menaquinone-dependent protoporphyrinogen oxidase
MSEQTKITRRRFLIWAGGAAGASALACSGLGVLATRAPDVTYIETLIEGAMPMNKILVAYATRAGSTSEVAETIGQTLNASGATVDVRPVKKLEGLQGYEAVVVGSAIRMGQWLPEAVQFVKTHQAALSTIPTAYFVVSGFLREDTPEKRDEVRAFLDPVRQILEPKSIGLFAGKMDYSKLSWLDRTIAKAVKSVEGDWRNWDAIRAWAKELSPTLGLTS